MSQTEFNKHCLHILVHYAEPFSAVFHDGEELMGLTFRLPCVIVRRLKSGTI